MTMHKIWLIVDSAWNVTWTQNNPVEGSASIVVELTQAEFDRTMETKIELKTIFSELQKQFAEEISELIK